MDDEERSWPDVPDISGDGGEDDEGGDHDGDGKARG